MMRRLAAFVAVEAGLALFLLVLAAAMTLTTPARHAPPTWPLPFRLSPDVVLDVPAIRWRVLIGTQLVVGGFIALLVSMLIRRRAKVLAGAVALVVFGVGIGLPPIVVSAYPTSYRRPLLTYHAGSIASGAAVYREHCAGCHGSTGVGAPPLPDLRAAAIARRHAGELFWLVTPGVPRRRMPHLGRRLDEPPRCDGGDYNAAPRASADA